MSKENVTRERQVKTEGREMPDSADVYTKIIIRVDRRSAARLQRGIKSRGCRRERLVPEANGTRLDVSSMISEEE